MVDRIVRRILVADVGISTGIVVADVIRYALPQLIYAGTLALDDLRGVSPDKLMIYYDIPSVELIVAEWPRLSSHSKFFDETYAAAAKWRRWIHAQDIPYMEVLPGTWKNTRAARANILAAQKSPDWAARRFSKHVKDAAQIAYWYSIRGWYLEPGSI